LTRLSLLAAAMAPWFEAGFVSRQMAGSSPAMTNQKAILALW